MSQLGRIEVKLDALLFRHPEAFNDLTGEGWELCQLCGIIKPDCPTCYGCGYAVCGDCDWGVHGGRGKPHDIIAHKGGYGDGMG